MRNKIAAVAVFMSLFATLAAGAEPKPLRTGMGGEPVKSILWVGNSFFFFNNGIHRFMRGLGHGAQPGMTIRNVMVAIEGSGLDWHDLDGYLRPDGRIGSYSFAPGNKIRFNAPGRKFDTVVMMDCSQCPIHPQLKDILHEYAKKDSDIARKYGARPVFFMSWAYKGQPEMTAQLEEAYLREGNANDALVIPAGLAYAKAIEKRPALELYQDDKRHPTVAGTYLAACTSFAALLGKSPVGNTYKAGLDDETAAFLQSIAWETVQEFFARPR